jgi:AraC family transcriptional regulator
MSARDDRSATAGRLLERVRAQGIEVTEVHNAAGCVLAEHAHEGATIGILLAGAVAERRDGLVRVQTAGEVFVRRKGVRHANQYLSTDSRSVFVELERDDPRAHAIGAVDALAWPQLAAAGEAVARAFQQGERGGRGELFRRVDALLTAAAALRPPRTPAWLEHARDRLAHEYARPPSLRKLAEVARVHPVHLAQSFRARWGLTVGAFVRAHRVFHAVSLLHGGMPLAEIAVTCGFADQSHMTRVVRASRGLPPGRLARVGRR